MQQLADWLKQRDGWRNVEYKEGKKSIYAEYGMEIINPLVSAPEAFVRKVAQAEFALYSQVEQDLVEYIESEDDDE